MEIQNIEPALWEPIRIQTDSAWMTHVPFAHWITVHLAPSITVELGTHTGVSYAAFCNAVSKAELATKCFAVDTWQGDSQAGFYSEKIFNDVDTFNKEHFAAFSTLIRSTFDEAIERFTDGSIDLLHIDGYHSYEAVSHDFATWLPKMSSKGIILFHDTNEKQEGFGVWKFWEEISNQHPSFHFLHGHGLGVLKIGEDIPNNLDFLFSMGNKDTDSFRNFFCQLGEKCAQLQKQKIEEQTFENKLYEQEHRWKAILDRSLEERNEYYDEQIEIILQEKEKYKTTLDNLKKEEKILYNNIWLYKIVVGSLEKDSLWRYLRKHPSLKRFLTKFISYIRAFLKRRLKQEKKRFSRAKKHAEIIKNSAFFDAKWYCQKYFDVAYSGYSPEMHYALFGKDGRLPSPLFNAQLYQEQYKDVATSDFPPLVHYELHGRSEKRYFQSFENIDLPGLEINTAPNNALKLDEEDLYANWIETTEKSYTDSLPVIDDSGIKRKAPLFSIIIPTYNSEGRFLRECIDSVIHQTYTDWQLCIADDASTNKSTIKVLKSFEKNPKIDILYRKENGHIAAASNSALEMAMGDYIVFLDHDDTLAPTALQELALEIDKSPNAGILYSDEDKIDLQNKRSSPFFKPDFSPDYLYSLNYICHIMVFKKSIIQKAGGFRPGYDGSQDYDLILRAISHLSPDEKIIHIPRILYHWRLTKNSTSTGQGNKDYSTMAAVKALTDYFYETNKKVKVSILEPGRYKIDWTIPEDAPLVSLIIPTRNNCNDLKTCIDSILTKTTYSNYEIVVVDNQSDEADALAYFEELKQNSRIKVIHYNHPFNYSAINNFAVQQTNGSIIGLINNDIEVVSPDWLTDMVGHCIRPDIGCVGAKLLYPDGSIQHAGVVLGIGGVAGHSHKYLNGDNEGSFSRLRVVQNVSAVTGAALLIRKQTFEEVGGLDEKNLPVAFNDIDLCLKVLSKGYRNIWTPFAVLIHHESKSRGQEDTPEKQERFIREINIMKNRWSDLLDNDPYYNPNLTLTKEDYSIKISI